MASNGTPDARLISPGRGWGKIGEDTNMNNLFLAMYVKLNNLMKQEEGQDLIEYALVAALIAVVSIAMMKSVGSAVNTVFSNISSALA
ncbi:MAG: Flp family type IVb pilin [Terracidiphilus sp.]